MILSSHLASARLPQAAPRSLLSRMAGVFLLVLAGLACQSTALAQTQLGADIDGEAAGDLSGYSVSLSADGSRLAIGARNNAGNGGSSGHVRVFSVWQPADAINDLKAYVNAQTFKTATKNSLIVKLNAALAALAIPDMPLACVRMQDFINLAKAQKAKKQIGATQADYMIAQATDIKLLMGCP